MPAHTRHDDPTFYQDNQTGRTSLSANTGSQLATFLHNLARVWAEPQVVSVVTRLDPAAFRNIELTTQIENDLVAQVWHKIAEQSIMPLAAPTVEWVRLSHIGPHLTSPPPEVIAELVKDQRLYPLRPGAELPDDSAALCFVSVPTAPLARAELAAVATTAT